MLSDKSHPKPAVYPIKPTNPLGLWGQLGSQTGSGSGLRELQSRLRVKMRRTPLGKSGPMISVTGHPSGRIEFVNGPKASFECESKERRAHHIQQGLLWRKCNAFYLRIMPWDRVVCFCERRAKVASQLAASHHASWPDGHPELYHSTGRAHLSRRFRSGRSPDRSRRSSCLR